jgi:hypothetical protein
MPGAFAAQTARFRNHRTQNNRRAATAARHAAIDAYALRQISAEPLDASARFFQVFGLRRV